jgi:hypothetical protein
MMLRFPSGVVTERLVGSGAAVVVAILFEPLDSAVPPAVAVPSDSVAEEPLDPEQPASPIDRATPAVPDAFNNERRLSGLSAINNPGTLVTPK